MYIKVVENLLQVILSQNKDSRKLNDIMILRSYLCRLHNVLLIQLSSSIQYDRIVQINVHQMVGLKVLEQFE